jgi:hypothetical protein
MFLQVQGVLAFLFLHIDEVMVGLAAPSGYVVGGVAVGDYYF